MTTTLTSEGFIVFDTDGIIHGFGASRDAAWDDCRHTFDCANIRLVEEHEEVDDDAPFIARERLSLLPASAALLGRIEAHGGNTSWGQRDGIACTVDEEEG